MTQEASIIVGACLVRLLLNRAPFHIDRNVASNTEATGSNIDGLRTLHDARSDLCLTTQSP
jgi:hypothetical protein